MFRISSQTILEQLDTEANESVDFDYHVHLSNNIGLLKGSVEKINLELPFLSFPSFTLIPFLSVAPSICLWVHPHPPVAKKQQWMLLLRQVSPL